MDITKVVIIAPTTADSYALDATCWDLSERWGTEVTWTRQRDYRKGWTARFTDEIGTATLPKYEQNIIRQKYNANHQSIYG